MKVREKEMGSAMKCSLCGKQLGRTWKKIIVRDAEERQRSIQLCTQRAWDICDDCDERFERFVKECTEERTDG